ncbi:8-oxoguanine dna n-terminal domain-containing protein [Cystoisospora suis]|uniref:8-oxoguanine dna n-terminal domain-containing protein n=1 Tax=Cystoisospora suis TaxID=483139 RepID=A0A2C6KKA9_9APIC|nr:8-oxoguanine dna n-terminal domain-containing protein [Cystoisospora suis]
MTACCSRNRVVKKKRKIDTAEKKNEHSKEANAQLPTPSSLGSENTEIYVPLSILLEAGWRDLSVSCHQLRPQHCLTTGQTFSFVRLDEDLWEGLVGRRVYQIKQTQHTTLYRCVYSGDRRKDGEQGKEEAEDECRRDKGNSEEKRRPRKRGREGSEGRRFEFVEPSKGFQRQTDNGNETPRDISKERCTKEVMQSFAVSVRRTQKNKGTKKAPRKGLLLKMACEEECPGGANEEHTDKQAKDEGESTILWREKKEREEEKESNGTSSNSLPESESDLFLNCIFARALSTSESSAKTMLDGTRKGEESEKNTNEGVQGGRIATAQDVKKTKKGSADEKEANERKALFDFFNLHISLPELQEQWTCYSPGLSRPYSSPPIPPQIGATSLSRSLPLSSSSPSSSSSSLLERGYEYPQKLSGLSCSDTQDLISFSGEQKEKVKLLKEEERSRFDSIPGRGRSTKGRQEKAGLVTPSSKAHSSVLPGSGRVLQVPLVECFFSFICSSNNNIPRITQMLASVRRAYGDFLVRGLEDTDAGESNKIHHHRLPWKTIRISGEDEKDLMPNIVTNKSVSLEDWLPSLKFSVDNHQGSVFIQKRNAVNGMGGKEGNEIQMLPGWKKNPSKDGCFSDGVIVFSDHPQRNEERKAAMAGQDIHLPCNLVKVKNASAVYWMLADRPKKTWYSFPSVDALASASPTELQSLGLGYRARLVSSAARTLVRLGGEDFLQFLKQRREIVKSTEGDRGSDVKEHDVFQVEREIHQTLLKFAGIGRKVADCIALYSLGCFSRWPLDTHMITHAALDPCLRVFLEDFMQHQHTEHGLRKRKTKEQNSKVAPSTLEFQSHNGKKEFGRSAAGELLDFTLSPASLRSFLSARSQKKGVEIVKSVNLSDGLYYLIQGFYQSQLGMYAGWAQSGIFANAVGSL